MPLSYETNTTEDSQSNFSQLSGTTTCGTGATSKSTGQSTTYADVYEVGLAWFPVWNLPDIIDDFYQGEPYNDIVERRCGTFSSRSAPGQVNFEYFLQHLPKYPGWRTPSVVQKLDTLVDDVAKKMSRGEDSPVDLELRFHALMQILGVAHAGKEEQMKERWDALYNMAGLFVLGPELSRELNK